ncbi:hypothetical protein AB0I60_00290 [Actinosynnema sp. NPDC050436]|uniref:hypothetical protein n=1 Tax=Actinosynnema sp. NPDC050436 TaxID=3155659 RepID=UPI00340CD6D1
MSTAELTPDEVAREAARAGLPAPVAQLDGLTVTANHVRRVVEILRELDFGDTPPAIAYHAQDPHGTDDGQERARGAL